MAFQYLHRAYKRSDLMEGPQPRQSSSSFNPSIGLTSVPTAVSQPDPVGVVTVSIPQSGLQAFRRAARRTEGRGTTAVSIPQSGLQAFRPKSSHTFLHVGKMFQ